MLASVRRAGKRVAPGTRSGAAPQAGPGAVGRVLVADRCPDTVESTKWLLRTWRHDVRGVGSGPEVLEAVEEYRPVAVLMEIGLPRLDGWQVARLLRQRGRRPPAWLAAVTGYGSALDRARSREAGFDGHFVKPADPEVLRAWLAVRCGTGGAADERHPKSRARGPTAGRRRCGLGGVLPGQRPAVLDAGRGHRRQTSAGDLIPLVG